MMGRNILNLGEKEPFKPIIEEKILEAVADFNGAEKSIPCLRTYENDLARLTLIGGVDFQQALMAAVAYGGEASGEHIVAGVNAMVVETLFPGYMNERSIVSTRLFLPTRKVMEKAQKLRSTLTNEMLSGTTSTNILAMTFRQVTLQHLWNFELVLFIPVAERNMDDLETPREVPPSFAITLSDERVISFIAEVICISALESTKRHLFDETPGGVAKKFFPWFHKHKSIFSKDSSVTLYNLMECEIVANADILLQKFSSERANYRPREGRWMVIWLTSNAYSKLEQTAGPELIAWLSEYVPAYKLQIDAEKLGNVKFEGWKETTTNTWEVFLTHSQMILHQKVSYKDNSGSSFVFRIDSHVNRKLDKPAGLVLSNNKLTGSIGDNLRKLQRLDVIDLTQNQLSGFLPNCLGKVTSLREIHMGSNILISNTLPSVGNLKDLVVLDLSSNNLVGSLHSEIGNLKAATLIDLSMNQLSNGIPKEIGGLQTLAYLSLKHNKLQ
ncbi:hypothetical protein BC332_09980 [Capsicum chinense]|nr:hypothetical protein BC332_09980 [Capsicum chinense]